MPAGREATDPAVDSANVDYHQVVMRMPLLVYSHWPLYGAVERRIGLSCSSLVTLLARVTLNGMGSSINTVLAGDVGGTKTLLAIYEISQGRLHVLREARYATTDYSTLSSMVRDFQADQRLDAAGFGLACPVTGRRVKLTNREFWIDADDLEQICGIPKVRLFNDFAAIGYGLEALEQDELYCLQQGNPHAQAPRALIGAGTGLGEAILVWQQDHYEVMSSEGGHVDFAPLDEEQIALLRALIQKYGHASYERLLSGLGLQNIFDFLALSERPSEVLLQDMHSGDAAAAISTYALGQRDPVAVKALDLFVRIYGQQASNLALTCLAQGGVYVAGGIAPKIIDKLKDGTFIRAFHDKGRYRGWLEQLPVYVVMNPKVGLLGAALAAGR